MACASRTLVTELIPHSSRPIEVVRPVVGPWRSMAEGEDAARPSMFQKAVVGVRLRPLSRRESDMCPKDDEDAVTFDEAAGVVNILDHRLPFHPELWLDECHFSEDRKQGAEGQLQLYDRLVTPTVEAAIRGRPSIRPDWHWQDIHHPRTIRSNSVSGELSTTRFITGRRAAYNLAGQNRAFDLATKFGRLNTEGPLGRQTGLDGARYL